MGYAPKLQLSFKKNKKTFYYTYNVCIFATMKRRNYYLLDDAINKLNQHKNNFGMNTVSAFIRYIINDFIKKHKL